MNWTALFGLPLALSLATGAPGQTLAISGVQTGNYTQQFDVPVATPFEIAVWMDPAGLGSKAIEFGYTDLPTIRPGVIQTNLVTIVPIFILPPCADGECSFGFGQCIGAANPLELVRFEYVDVSGFTGTDVVLTLGPTVPSSFGGAPGFVDCDDNLVPLEVGGTVGGVTGSGAVFPAGSMVLNPTPIVLSGDAANFGRLKARYE